MMNFHVCNTFPLCKECSEDYEFRICPECGQLQWDESEYCDVDSEKLIHNCEWDIWNCPIDMCENSKSSAQADAENDMAYEDALNRAGGLDEVQRRERLAFYGE